MLEKQLLHEDDNKKSDKKKRGRNNIVLIRALLDTGTSETIILKSYLSSNTIRGYKGTPVKWKTLGGNFETHCQAQIQFAFPELSDKKYITWITHVDQHTNPNKALLQYT
jgi:hypothetical protein